jgi:uncharacterized protein (DUF1800 family)
VRPVRHRAAWEAADAAAKAADPTNASAGTYQNGTINAFWRAAVGGQDQLRQRVAFALSQIFVISLVDGNVGDDPRAVAAYMDMLAQAFGNYRELLQAVSLHPMMGMYLSHLKQPEGRPGTGRVPDENYAREVMQLFSIGLAELDAGRHAAHATAATRSRPYTPADIAGLARCSPAGAGTAPPSPATSCFYSGSSSDGERPRPRLQADGAATPATTAPRKRRFLKATHASPAQTTADPVASLRRRWTRCSTHPNVGPFIGKQLIQRLVTSNPSPAYVAAVSPRRSPTTATACVATCGTWSRRS